MVEKKNRKSKIKCELACRNVCHTQFLNEKISFHHSLTHRYYLSRSSSSVLVVFSIKRTYVLDFLQGTDLLAMSRFENSLKKKTQNRSLLNEIGMFHIFHIISCAYKCGDWTKRKSQGCGYQFVLYTHVFE